MSHELAPTTPEIEAVPESTVKNIGEVALTDQGNKELAAAMSAATKASAEQRALWDIEDAHSDRTQDEIEALTEKRLAALDNHS